MKTFPKKLFAGMAVTLLCSLFVGPIAYANGYTATNQTTGTPLSGKIWRTVASSGSGKYLAAAETGGDVYTSNDYGEHWVDTTAGTAASGQNYTRMTASYTGQYFAAITQSGDIWVSSDYGAQWTNRTTGTGLSGLNWQHVISSYTGKYIAATAYTDGVFVSNDYGAHWTDISNGTALDGLGVVYMSISADGKYLTANVDGDSIYGSQDYGATWSKLTTGGLDGQNWYGVAASADGKKIVGEVLGGDIYTSDDYGSTWTNRTTGTGLSGLNWVYLQASPTGQSLVTMLDSGGDIYTSHDYGVTWSQLTTGPLSSLYWNAAAISASGQHVAAVAGSADIYNFNAPSLAPPKPVLSAVSSNVAVNGSVTVNVLTGASGYDPDTFAIISGPAHGTAVDPPGDITYTPNRGYYGADSVTYQVCAPLDNTVCSQGVLAFTIGPAPPNTGFGSPGSRMAMANALALCLLSIGPLAYGTRLLRRSTDR